MGKIDLSKWAVKKTVRFYNGKAEIQISDFLDGETCQASIVDSEGLKDTQKVSFSQELIEALNDALNNAEIKSAVIFKV